MLTIRKKGMSLNKNCIKGSNSPVVVINSFVLRLKIVPLILELALFLAALFVITALDSDSLVTCYISTSGLYFVRLRKAEV